MQKLSEAFLSDGRLLEEKFEAADGIISAGELDYNEFSSLLVRKVIYLQLELSKDGAEERYDKEKVDDFRGLARHFLTELKDGTLTQTSQCEVGRQLKIIFPKLHFPKTSRKRPRPAAL